MKKVALILGGLALAGCGAGTIPAIVVGVFDAVNSYTQSHCGYTFTTATIDAVIKAFGGKPVEDVIGSFLCTQAKALAAQQAPKAAGTNSAGSAIVDLGTIDIGGKPVRIQVVQ